MEKDVFVFRVDEQLVVMRELDTEKVLAELTSRREARLRKELGDELGPEYPPGCANGNAGAL